MSESVSNGLRWWLQFCFCIYFNHLFKYQRKIYRGCGGTFGWTDVPFPVTERSGDDGRCDNRFDQLLDLHYIQSRHLFFKYDFGGDSWYNAYTLFNTFGGAMQILAMMLFFPILRKFLGTIQVFYTSFVMAILGYAVLLILMFVNMSNLYLLFVPAFFIFSAWNVIRSHNGIPCEYGRLRRVEESQKG